MTRDEKIALAHDTIEQLASFMLDIEKNKGVVDPIKLNNMINRAVTTAKMLDPLKRH